MLSVQLHTSNILGEWFNTYLLTYLLTPWSRVLLEKLARFQLVNKFPTFYGTGSLTHSQVPATCLYPAEYRSVSKAVVNISQQDTFLR